MPALREYQVDVTERARGHYRNGCRRVLLQAATGAGKTHISSEICRCAVAKGKRVLFLAHRRRLISQKCERLREFGVPYGVLMAGVRYNEAPVQVGSRDTLLSRSLRNDHLALPHADLVIVDEAHNCMADEYQALLECYRQSLALGLTATPATSNGKGLGSYFEALECAVPTSQLVREGWLVPVRCYGPERARKGKRTLCGDPVKHWRDLAMDRPTVLFTSKVATSLSVCKAFNDAGIPAEHIDSHTPDEQRDAVIARLCAGWTKIVCNVGIWLEGVDVPQLSCCIMLRMAGSYVLFLQAVGRIMRSHPTKQDAILIDHSGAVLKHGFPDQDIEWSLDTEETVDKRLKAARKARPERQTMCCPACSLLFPAADRCPGCGKLMGRPQRATPTHLHNEILTELRRSRTPEETREEQVRYWHTCLRIMACKGRTAGAAAHMYRQRFREWPDDSLPNIPHWGEWKQPVAELFPQYLPASRSHV